MPFAKGLTAILILLSLSFISKAQTTLSPYEIGIHTGASLYLGDLTPSVHGSYKSPGFTIGFNGSKNISRTLSIRADLNFLRLRANDSNYSTPAWKKQRNFNFKTNVTELGASLVWNFLGTDHLLSPYVFGGIGYSFIRVKRDYSHFNTEYFATEPTTLAGLAYDTTHALPKGSMVIPFGAGISYALSNRLTLNAETAYRVSYTDYLDGFSHAANPAKNDSYFTHTVGISYRFAGKNKMDCPKVPH